MMGVGICQKSNSSKQISLYTQPVEYRVRILRNSVYTSNLKYKLAHENILNILNANTADFEKYFSTEVRRIFCNKKR